MIGERWQLRAPPASANVPACPRTPPNRPPASSLPRGREHRLPDPRRRRARQRAARAPGRAGSPRSSADRAPKVVHTDDGDFWSFDDGKSVRPVGLTATAGLSYLDYKPAGITYEEMRPGSFDTKARLADLDVDGIYLQVLVPERHAVGRQGLRLGARAAERVRPRLQRLARGVLRGERRPAHRPGDPADDRRRRRVAEIEARPRARPSRRRDLVVPQRLARARRPRTTRFWAFAQEADIPVAVHIGSFIQGMGTGPAPTFDTLAFMGLAGATKAGSHTIPVVCDFIFSGHLRAVHEAEAAARRVEHRVDPLAARAGRRHVLALPVVHQRRRADAHDAEPHLLPELLGDVHDRHRRHRAASPHERRPSDVVDRLPAHRERLAEQPGDDRAQLPRRAGRTTSRRCSTTTAAPSTSSTTSPRRSTEAPWLPVGRRMRGWTGGS